MLRAGIQAIAHPCPALVVITLATTLGTTLAMVVTTVQATVQATGRTVRQSAIPTDTQTIRRTTDPAMVGDSAERLEIADMEVRGVAMVLADSREEVLMAWEAQDQERRFTSVDSACESKSSTYTICACSIRDWQACDLGLTRCESKIRLLIV